MSKFSKLLLVVSLSSASAFSKDNPGDAFKRAIADNSEALKAKGIDASKIDNLEQLVNAVAKSEGKEVEMENIGEDIKKKLEAALKEKADDFKKINVDVKDINLDDFGATIRAIIKGVLTKVEQELSKETEGKEELRTKLHQELSTEKAAGDLKKLNLKKEDLLKMEPMEALKLIVEKAVTFKAEEAKQEAIKSGMSKEEAEKKAMHDLLKDM